jgi:rhodanese-related sulfurtransferase
VANIEEARVLWSSDGYTIVDLRSEFEREEEGTITAESGSIHIPLISAEKVYNAELDKKVILQQPNPQFLEQINSCFSPDDKFIVMDSDGKDRALQALALLDKAGYTSSVCMRGGYNTWQVAFDQQLQRRFPDAQSVMELEAMADKDPVSWLDWATAMDPCPLKVKE